MPWRRRGKGQPAGQPGGHSGWVRRPDRAEETKEGGQQDAANSIRPVTQPQPPGPPPTANAQAAAPQQPGLYRNIAHGCEPPTVQTEGYVYVCPECGSIFDSLFNGAWFCTTRHGDNWAQVTTTKGDIQ